MDIRKENLIRIILLLLLLPVIFSCEKGLDAENNGKLKSGKTVDPDDLPGDTVFINYNDTLFIGGPDQYMIFDSVIEDSRCPAGAMCFWEGEARIQIRFFKEGRTSIFSLLLGAGDVGLFVTDDYRLKLISLRPYPELHKEIIKEDYVAGLLFDTASIHNPYYTGIVKDYTGLDGCGLVIELDNGIKLEPVQLPPGFNLQPEMRVRLQYTELKNMASICMAGIIARIDYIEAIDCKSVEKAGIDFDVATLPDDSFEIVNAEIEGRCLVIKVAYSGGCEVHDFRLVKLFEECGTPTVPPAQLILSHNANGDQCEAYLRPELKFDLSGLLGPDKDSVVFTLSTNVPGDDFQQTFHYP